MIFENVETVKEILDFFLESALQDFDIPGKNEADARGRMWLIKKGRIHPYLVLEHMRCLARQKETAGEISRLAINALELDTVALLHDLGRLSEINVKTGIYQEIKNTHPYTHGDLSAIILEQYGEDDPDILLPIKYHDKYDFDVNLALDKHFQALPFDNQEKIVFIWKMLLDADRLANFSFQAANGLNNTAELLDGRIHSSLKINPQIAKTIMNGTFVSLGNYDWRQSYLDVWLVFMYLAQTLHFECGRRLFLKKYFKGMQAHLEKELATAPGTDEERQRAADFIWKFYKQLTSCVKNVR